MQGNEQYESNDAKSFLLSHGKSAFLSAAPECITMMVHFYVLWYYGMNNADHCSLGGCEKFENFNLIVCFAIRVTSIVSTIGFDPMLKNSAPKERSNICVLLRASPSRSDQHNHPMRF